MALLLSRTRLPASMLARHASSSASFKFKNECKGHLLDTLPPTEDTATSQELLKYFKDMSVIRRMETTAQEAYREKKIRGFLHLYSGQEAVAVGMMAALTPKDSIITAYRCHGWAYMCGWSPKAVLAELFGRADGASLGKGGSMHFYKENFYGGNGIVGAQVPVGAGIALAHQYRGEPNVCIALYGDGAANQGQCFEAYNIAKLWKLPVIFVCENNKYGMGTHDYRSSASTKYYTRGDYVPGLWVDGMDVLAVRSATKFAKEFALQNGPIVLEMETYRYHGHSMSDPDDTYRTRDDIKKKRETDDPISMLRHRILSADLASEEQLKALEKEARDSVKADYEAAVASPEPPFKELYNHVFIGEKLKDVRGCDLLTTYSQ